MKSTETLCSRNLRIGFFGDGVFLKVQNNILSGPLGKFFNHLLFSAKDQGNCSFRLVPPVRSFSDVGNSSFSDLFRHNLIDLGFVETRLSGGDHVTTETSVTDQYSFQVGQFLKPYSKKMDISSFLVNNIQLLMLIIFGYLLLAAASAVLPNLTHANSVTRLKSLKLVLFRAPFIDHNKLPRVHLRLMLFVFSLFLFLNLNLLAGTIKTEKITVDSEEIVDSASKLIATPKTMVFKKAELNAMQLAPEGSFLKRLATSQKNFLEVNSFHDLIRMKTTGINDHVIFMDLNFLCYIIDLLSTHAKETGSIAFAKLTAYYEYLTVYPIRRSLEEERKRFIRSRINLAFEHGAQVCARLKIRGFFINEAKRNVKVYESIEDFIGDVTRKVSPNVTLDNTENLFFFFGGLLMLISHVFFVEFFLFKQLQKINRQRVRPSTLIIRGLKLRESLLLWKPVNFAQLRARSNQTNRIG